MLVLGESGTGKELVARAIHDRSRAREQAVRAHPLRRAAREVLESELFGHEKGAFTGAIATKPGLIELADGGTLFLDEIGEMEPESQVKLLRVLESHAFFRVGGTRRRTVDMRLVAATNRDLAEAIKTGGFRQDLFYRINTITITLPPLRERREDVRRLTEHFLEQNATYGRKRLSDAAMESLERYDWPGNVRELQHAVQRAVILSHGRSDPARRPAGGDPRRAAHERDAGGKPRGHGAPAHHRDPAQRGRSSGQGGHRAPHRPQDALPQDPGLRHRPGALPVRVG